MTDSGNIMNFHFFYKVAKTIRCLLKFTNEEFITDEWLQFCSPKIFLVLNTRKDTGILARRNSIKREGEINIELHKLSICWDSLPLPSHISHFDSFKLGDKTWGKNHLEAIIGSAQGVQHFWLLRSGRGGIFSSPWGYCYMCGSCVMGRSAISYSVNKYEIIIGTS